MNEKIMTRAWAFPDACGMVRWTAAGWLASESESENGNVWESESVAEEGGGGKHMGKHYLPVTFLLHSAISLTIYPTLSSLTLRTPAVSLLLLLSLCLSVSLSLELNSAGQTDGIIGSSQRRQARP